MKILIILTSHDELGDTGKKTGFWVEEFASPYYVFADAGAELTIASPKGGQPPIDPKSEAADAQTPATQRFSADKNLQEKLANTSVLAEINADDYDAVFYPGGHGPLWDLANNQHSIQLIKDFFKQEKPVALVCHAPAALIHVNDEDGLAVIKGKLVTGFSNTEEEAVQLTEVVPFLLEDELKKIGGIYSKGEDWTSYVIHDGLLITGQNPGSSEEVAQELLKLLAH